MGDALVSTMLKDKGVGSYVFRDADEFMEKLMMFAITRDPGADYIDVPDADEDFEEIHPFQFTMTGYVVALRKVEKAEVMIDRHGMFG